MTEAVLADAQFGIYTLLKPARGFEEYYLGESVNKPIMMAPEGKMLDDLAGQPGYNSHLVPGYPCPFGARMVLLIPLVTATCTQGQPPFGHTYYKWVIWWRVRTLYGYRLTRGPYRLAKQSLGVEALNANAEDEIVLPVAGNPVVYAQNENTVSMRQVNDIKAFEDVWPRGRERHLELPLVRPPGAAAAVDGVLQQGFPQFTASGFDYRTAPSFMLHEVQALGDEMLLGVYRDENIPTQDDADTPTEAHPNWEFGTPGGPLVADGAFSGVFGSDPLPYPPQDRIYYPVSGVYVTVGSAP